MKKNNLVILKITDITSDGNGVGHIENTNSIDDGMTVFVPSTAVGDVIECRIVKVLKHMCYGIIERIIEPSTHRVDRGCSVQKACGGCIFRHISYDAELDIKKKIVIDAFTRLGKFDKDNLSFEGILGCTETNHYRNKAQYPVAMIDNKAVFGFYARRSHRVVPCNDCELQPKLFGEIASYTLDIVMAKGITIYDESKHTGSLRHIYIRKGYHTNETCLCLIARRFDKRYYDVAKTVAKKFSEIKSIILNINPDKTNVITGKECITLYGSDTIVDTMCGNKIEISPLSFYQINTAQAEKLYKIAGEYASYKGDENVLELYCGAGTIGLSMAKSVGKILGAEIIPEAVENAKANAKANNITNAEFICADAGKMAEKVSQSDFIADVIVTDPPRKGCDELTLKSIIKLNPSRIVMISCNPATAATDCSYLANNGYRIEKLKAVDLFPGTAHIETVILMNKV